MRVQVHYQGLEPSPWVDEFVGVRISKLERFLGPSCSVDISFRLVGERYQTVFWIKGLIKDHAFCGEGENLYESFISAMDQANRTLIEQKRRLKSRSDRSEWGDDLRHKES